MPIIPCRALQPILLTKQKVPLFKTLISSGLANGLKLCLDAGDIFSAPSGATSWLDQTVNGYDFFRGTTSGAEATDPTFNGMVGNLSKDEYWSFDGGDLFQYDSANETWMESIHKAGAKFTITAWIWVGSASANGCICGDRGAAAGDTGFVFNTNATDNLRFNVANAGTSVLTLTTAAAIPAVGQWIFTAMSLDEAVGANGAILQLNGTKEIFTSTYVAPSAAAASFGLQIGAGGNAFNPFPAASRMGMTAMWQGVALTANELMAIYNATRKRFGV